MTTQDITEAVAEFRRQLRKHKPTIGAQRKLWRRMLRDGNRRIEHFAPQDATETAERFGASAALGPEDIGDEPDTDVEPPDGHEIDGISDPD